MVRVRIWRAVKSQYEPCRYFLVANRTHVGDCEIVLSSGGREEIKNIGGAAARNGAHTVLHPLDLGVCSTNHSCCLLLL